ncbi:selenium metabolism-associated LysR family transcriptional regulator [Desulfotomaculum copahuensis]|uniref:Transcriptional regulator n=1 Tax=Desulfotomaculum copahuensis TaxID=1838280 RepID=A0A1B7LHF6_9FIRM|nr:selenium metabolism-associated LysR family transcriptional regulator [Desulfotomaculum copahuensis]OAT85713.1 transcriptional regulator [Desulfotomaculum copahuensis]
MNLKQLEAFLLVAELRNFTRAAGQLGMSQPAVSFQIKALEEELQVTLLERTEKKVVLTEAGRLLYPEARQMLRHYRKIRAVVDELRGLKSGHLILGATDVPGECLLPVFIGAFREQYPGVRVTLRVGSNAVILRWLQEREVDLGILGLTAAGEGIRYYPWLEEQLVFIVPGWHPLAGNQVNLEEVTREPLLIREQDSGTRQVLESKLAEHNISLQDFPSVLELGSSQAIIRAAGAGLGTGVVSRRAAADARAAGRVKELTVPGWQLKQTFYLAWTHQPPASNLTVNTFREFIQDRDTCQRLLGE